MVCREASACAFADRRLISLIRPSSRLRQVEVRLVEQHVAQARGRPGCKAEPASNDISELWPRNSSEAGELSLRQASALPVKFDLEPDRRRRNAVVKFADPGNGLCEVGEQGQLRLELNEAARRILQATPAICAEPWLEDTLIDKIGFELLRQANSIPSSGSQPMRSALAPERSARGIVRLCRGFLAQVIR